jgi:hypothetical protein
VNYACIVDLGGPSESFYEKKDELKDILMIDCTNSYIEEPGKMSNLQEKILRAFRVAR